MEAKENSDNPGSPEERLLRIIKGQSKAAKAGLNKLPQSQGGQLEGKLPLDGQAAGPSHKAKELRAVFGKDSLSKLALLGRFNAGLFIFWCLLVMIIFVFARIAAMAESSKRHTKGPFIKEDSMPEKEKFQVLPFSYYADIISRGGFFKTSLTQETQDIKMPAQIAPLELLKGYTLAGVITGENPQAIVEDKTSKKAYFLNKGQYLGDFKIDDIMEGKIILELKGQRFELSL
ncbi:MAG: hypothetical protein A3J51_00835 [Omnitrophica WOR_2 bacterium RIFCSPHIGHO2_02_FULL_45_21]|nr:MAG: hypothetical protein A3J51_00835 [Omnitrophica WOR_2 bacterium RIFCSPHIGHO2_02_FULL_45_21]